VKRGDLAITRLSAICTVAGLPALAWLDMPAKEWLVAVREALARKFS
jgi:hypothetical protein